MRSAAAIAVAIVLLFAAPPAEAQPRQGDAKPWARDVSAADQAKAMDLFRQGNTFFEEARYSEALARYADAVGAWDHPAIRFNMAVCYINLDRPLEARANLEKALSFGDAPLGADLFAQAGTYRKLLAGQLARVTVRARQTGVEVSLDGVEVLTGPGSVTRWVRAGRHEVVASKTGLLTDRRSLALAGGEHQTLAIDLIPIEQATHMERRMATWVPWTVMASGLALGAIGLGLRLHAGSGFDQYDRDVEEICPEGCNEDDLPASVRGVKTRAEIEDTAALISIGVGGAALVGGVVLLVLNQPRAVSGGERPRARSALVPSIAPGRVGASLTLDF